MRCEMKPRVYESSPTKGLALDVLATLRRHTEHQCQFVWRLHGVLPQEQMRIYRHLLPPEQGGGNHGDEWRRSHDVGLWFYRRGPGFITIKDRRGGPQETFQFVADRKLTKCLSMLTEPSDHCCDTCAFLDYEGIVMKRGHARLLLPTKLRFPPIPFSAL